MSNDLKYGRVTTEHGGIPDDEPVFIFRARDRNVIPVLDAYRDICAESGSPEFHLEMIKRNRDLIQAWQEANPGRVRVPDSESSRERLGRLG